MSDTLLTTAEAAAYLGVKIPTLRDYYQAGKIAPAGRVPTRSLLWQREELDAARIAHGIGRVISYRALVGTGRRRCRICHEVKRLDLFHPSPRSLEGHEHRCEDCCYRQDVARYSKERRGAWGRAWRVRNADRHRVIALSAYHRQRAIEDGKSSPICRQVGFSLVRPASDPAHWRPARLDKPINAGEVALARYEWSASHRQWLVTEPPVVPSAFRAEASALTLRLARKESQIVKGAKA